jgi:hypothetical protein
MTSGERTEANLRAYAIHQRVVGSLFWLPTVLLYLIDQVGLTQALQLGALYYLTVVVLEVPSGWFSDHVGRVAALRVTAVAWVGCHVLFLVGGLGPIAGAQVLLAVGYAFLSGTDSTFHFDVLDADGRSSEFESREARVRTGLLYATAVTAIVGGCLALVDLRLPFVAALLAAAVQLGATVGMSEPPRSARQASFAADLRSIAGHLRRPLLAWVTIYVVVEVVLIHLVSELAPPYLVMVLERPTDEPAGAAVIAGLLAATVAAIGGLSLRYTESARQRFGVGAVLLALASVTAAASVAMALFVSFFVLPLVVSRGVQMAATQVMVPGIISRRVEQHHRATMLSVTSLLGRCTYAMVLLVIAAEHLPRVLDTAAMVAVVAALLAVVTAIRPSVAAELRADQDAT